MPELPEVETVVRDVRPHLVGRRISGVELGRKRPLKTAPHKIVEGLSGALIESVERWGKNIVIRAENNGPVWWLIHLGMSGRLNVVAASEERVKHTHGIFTIDPGDFELRFNDPRMFGRIEVWRGKMPPRLAELGPEPLEVSEAEFAATLRLRRTRLKALLLDQSFVRGVGNIYADEALFRAGIDPRVIGTRTSAARAAALHAALQHVLQTAIESKGSSVRTYLYGSGEAGRYQYEHKVYGRSGSQCTVCATIIRSAVVAGRTTAWCPVCQTKGERKGKRQEAKGKRQK